MGQDEDRAEDVVRAVRQHRISELEHEELAARHAELDETLVDEGVVPSGLERAQAEAERIAAMTPDELAAFLEPMEDPDVRQQQATEAAASRKEWRRRMN